MIKQLNTSKNIYLLCKPLFEIANINYFGHVRFYKNKLANALVTNHDVLQHFMTNNYQGPSLNNGELPKSGIYFPSLSGMYNENQAKTQREMFLMNHPLYIVQQGDDFVDTFFMTSNNQDPSVYEHYLQNAESIEIFINIYLNKSRELQKNAYNNVLTDYYKAHETAFSLQEDIKIKILDTMLRDLSIHNISKYKMVNSNFEKITVSRREMQTLICLAIGMTAKSTANLMNRSTKTVEAHLNNLKIKFKVDRRSELIAIFLRNHSRYFDIMLKHIMSK